MGKIELDHTGAGSGITLSSDGTDLLLNGTAIGGGGTALELYAENPSSPTAPSATGANSVAIGESVTSSGTNSFAAGSFTTASGDNSVAISGSVSGLYPASAQGAGSIVVGNNASSNTLATSSLALGSQAVTAGTRATALTKSYASGTGSFAAAIGNNTSSYGATGASSVAIGYQARTTTNYGVAIGYLAKCTAGDIATAIGPVSTASGWYSSAIGGLSLTASQTHASAIGGGSNTASSTYATVIGGGLNTSSSPYSIVTGGRNNTANAQYSRVGGYYSTSQGVEGKDAWASGRFSAQGDAQTGTFVLRSDTTDATPEALTTNNSTAGTTNQVILPNNSAYAFHGTIVAREQASAGTDCAAWKIEGLIRREGSAGTTVLVNSATTVLDNTPAWGMALSADTTNGGLKIEVTGAAATNIRWVATINTSEVTY